MSVAQDLDLLKSFGQIAAPAGLAIGAFLYIARDLIAKNVFPTLTRERAYHVIVALAFMAWTVAIAGISSWTYVATHTSDTPDTSAAQLAVAGGILDDLSAGDFVAVYSHFSDTLKYQLPPQIIKDRWDQIVETLGPAKIISKPMLSSFNGLPAYVSLYQGTNATASVYVAFDTHGDVDVLWFDWHQ